MDVQAAVAKNGITVYKLFRENEADCVYLALVPDSRDAEEEVANLLRAATIEAYCYEERES